MFGSIREHQSKVHRTHGARERISPVVHQGLGHALPDGLEPREMHARIEFEFLEHALEGGPIEEIDLSKARRNTKAMSTPCSTYRGRMEERVSRASTPAYETPSR